MFGKQLLFALCIFSIAFARYLYQPNKSMPQSAIIYQSGSTKYEDLVYQCDQLGLECAGFDTYGNLYSTVFNASYDYILSMFVKVGGPVPTPLPNLVPLPQQYTFGNSTLYLITEPFTFQCNINSPILSEAFRRYYSIIFYQGNVTYLNTSSFNTLTVSVNSDNDTLQLGIDESYQITINANTQLLKANTIYGALRGLETFSQLVHYDSDLNAYRTDMAPISISDAPTFSHRGILIDVSRHFIPIPQLQKVVDSLSYAKMNVLHLHISDAQSFPLQSETYPDLWKGSYSKKERYTQYQITELVQYAKFRGVRVVPEIDGPGHMWAWGTGYPTLLPSGYISAPECANVCPNNPCDVPIDPTNPLIYEVLTGLLGELTGYQPRSGVFFDDFFHIGGDEVEYGCWNESAEILEFMQANNIPTFDGIYEYFVLKYFKIATSYGRIPINWEEVFNHFGTQLPITTIIHVWLNRDTIANVTKNGYRAIISEGWYLDHLNQDWTAFYLNDPYEFVATENQHLVMGGESCMWGETVDISDQLARIWPKSAAVAERLWNYGAANVPSAIELAIPRLHDFRCRITERGISAAPLYSPNPNQPSSCYAM